MDNHTIVCSIKGKFFRTYFQFIFISSFLLSLAGASQPLCANDVFTDPVNDLWMTRKTVGIQSDQPIATSNEESVDYTNPIQDSIETKPLHERDDDGTLGLSRRNEGILYLEEAADEKDAGYTIMANSALSVPRLADRYRPVLAEFASQTRYGVSNADVYLSRVTDSSFTMNYSGWYSSSDPKAFIFGGYVLSYVVPFTEEDIQAGRDRNGNGIKDDNELIRGKDTFNFNQIFPQGFSIGLRTSDWYSQPGNEFKVELTDIYGSRDYVNVGNYVSMTGRTNGGQMVIVNLTSNYFTSVNLGAIKQIAFVFEGTGQKRMDVALSGYDYVEEVKPGGASASDLSELPMVTGTITEFESGEPVQKPVRFRPSVSTFNSIQGDRATAQVGLDFINRQEFLLSYVGDDQEAYGGAFIHYDADWTTPESSDPIKYSVFGDGLVIGVSAPDENGDGNPDVTEVILEITDEDAEYDLRSKVRLTGLTTQTQYYRITQDMFDSEIHFDKIKTISLVFDRNNAKVVSVGGDQKYKGTVKVSLKGLDYSQEIVPDSNPRNAMEDMKALPLVRGQVKENDPYTGEPFLDPTGFPLRRDIRFRPDVSPFWSTVFADAQGNASLNPVTPDPADPTGYKTIPIASSTVTTPSENQFNLFYSSSSKDGFGGIFLNYEVDPDDPDANQPLNFKTYYDGTGLVIGLSSPGTNVSTARLELTDESGFKSSVILTGLKSQVQYYRIQPGDFDSAIDLGRIKTMALVYDNKNSRFDISSGTYDARLNVEWKGWNYIPDLRAGTATTFSPMPYLFDQEGNRVGLPELVSYDNDGVTRTGPDGSVLGTNTEVDLQFQSNSSIDVLYNGKKKDSYGGVFVNYDLLPDDSFVDTVNLSDSHLFPGGLTIGLSSTNIKIGNTNYGAIPSVLLGLEDADGDRQSIRLTGLNSNLQYYKVDPADIWDGIDLTRIRTISLTVESKDHGSGLKTFHIDWGNFNITAYNPFL